MEILLTRNASAPTGTPGWLLTEDEFTCNTLELPWKGNRKKLSCVKADQYRLTIEYHDHFKCEVIRLEDKNGRVGVMLHPMNFAGDVEIDANHDRIPDFFSQSEGCIGVGTGFGLISRPDGVRQLGIKDSRKTLAALIEHLGVGQHKLTIRWTDGAAPTDKE